MEKLDFFARPGWMQGLGLRPGSGWLGDPRFALAIAIALHALQRGLFFFCCR